MEGNDIRRRNENGRGVKRNEQILREKSDIIPIFELTFRYGERKHWVLTLDFRYFCLELKQVRKLIMKEVMESKIKLDQMDGWSQREVGIKCKVVGIKRR